jgi:exodeoxyribonuclease VII small subunit
MKEIKIDEGFEVLSDIIKNMDDENISLEDSFKLYNDGIETIKNLTKVLDETEEKVRIINEEKI